MSTAVTMLVNFVYYLISVVQLAMLVRAVLSWVMPDAEGALINFLYAITEPFIGIIRRITDRFVNYSGPLDLSFAITVILLTVIQLILAPYR